MKYFIVTINGEQYEIRAKNIDEAVCTAYRKFHKGNFNVFSDILWHVGVTKDEVSVEEGYDF
jgi:hypothetical protein